MKRWNGWGYTNISYPLHTHGKAFLRSHVGEGKPWADAKLDDVVRTVPASRLPSHPVITTDPVERIRHSTGQSLPDWITMRSGHYTAIADGVAYPNDADDVRDLIQYTRDAGIKLIPYGGGSSVVGHLTPPGDVPSLMLDMSHLNTLTTFDERSQLATFQAGVLGPDLEAVLRGRGYTLGHFPQSFEFSTLGGWVATRSSGQQSHYYGRIEGLFAGGRIETPLGTMDIAPLPASAAGTDLREVILGSEGKFGVITEAIVRVSPLPAYEVFEGAFFPNFEQGLAAVRAIAQANLPFSMLRLSNPAETETNLMLAHSRAIPILERYLAVRGANNEKCMLVFGVTGNQRVGSATRKEILSIIRQHGGLIIGKMLGATWQKNRFRGAYLRNTAWELGYAVDTLETAVPWSLTQKTINDIEAAIRSVQTQVHVFTHLSHVYTTGSSIYTTYIFPLANSPEATLSQWHAMKTAASRAVVANGGTISHQHGVGRDHLPYLEAEKGSIGMQVIASLEQTFNPEGVHHVG